VTVRNLRRILVFNASMTRLVSASVLALVAVAALAASASARVIELGQVSQKVVGSCPEETTCRVVTRTTGYQVRAAGIEAPVTVPSNGRIVAFTLYLGDPTNAQIKLFDDRFGGAAKIRVAVLRKVKGKKLVRSLVAQSGTFSIVRHFGTTAQFPLGTALDARAKDIVAVSVPTWAPILSISQAAGNAWRASRAASGCNDFSSLTAQLVLKSSATYGCTYAPARLAYSVTLIPWPKRKYDAKHNKPK
jgi:hypothetical protein